MRAATSFLLLGVLAAGGAFGQTAPPWVMEDATDALNQIAFSHDSKLFATVSQDNVTRIYSIPEGKLMHHWSQGKGSQVISVAFSMDNNFIATGSEDTVVRLYDISHMNDTIAPAFAFELKDSNVPVTSIAFSNNSRWLVTGAGGAGGGTGGSNVRIYSMEKLIEGAPALRYVLGDATAHVSSVAFSPDSAWLATGSYDNTTRLYAFQGSLLPIFSLKDTTMQVTSLQYSPAGNWLAAGSYDSVTRVYSVDPMKGETPKLAFNLTNPPYPLGPYRHNAVLGVGFTPCSRFVATGNSDGIARVWALNCTGPFTPPGCKPGHVAYSIPKVAGGLTSVAFSPDYSQFGTACYDHKARIYKHDHHADAEVSLVI